MTILKDGQRVISKDSAVSIGVVISLIIVSVWSSTNYQVSKNELQNQQKSIVQLENKVAELSAELKTHEAKGIDGYPHPEGIINMVNQLKTGQIDRWKKIDDYLYMKEYSTLNNLKMPLHITVEESTRKPTNETK